MADIIIKELNKRIADQVSNSKPSGTDGSPGISKFDQVLSSKQDNALLEKFVQDVGGDNKSDKLQVLSADNIKINISNSEFKTTSTFDGKKALTEMFSALNSDSVKMESIVEVLSADNTKLSRQQLLAYQGSLATLTLNIEMSSKFATQVSQNLNTLLQTNMG